MIYDLVLETDRTERIKVFSVGSDFRCGPSADTGSLMQNHAPMISADHDMNCSQGVATAGGRHLLRSASDKPVTERAGAR